MSLARWGPRPSATPRRAAGGRRRRPRPPGRDDPRPAFEGSPLRQPDASPRLRDICAHPPADVLARAGPGGAGMALQGSRLGGRRADLLRPSPPAGPRPDHSGPRRTGPAHRRAAGGRAGDRPPVWPIAAGHGRRGHRLSQRQRLRHEVAVGCPAGRAARSVGWLPRTTGRPRASCACRGGLDAAPGRCWRPPLRMGTRVAAWPGPGPRVGPGGRISGGLADGGEVAAGGRVRLLPGR